MEAGEDDGFVRIVSDKATGRILGVQAVGTNVSELSSAFVTLRWRWGRRWMTSPE